MAEAGSWDALADVAPFTKRAFDTASRTEIAPVLHGVPFDALGLAITDPTDERWMEYLSSPASLEPGVTNREVLLRYTLTRAIVDQGSDIEGVEMWHRLLIERCYDAQIHLLHTPRMAIERYAEVLDIADAARNEVTSLRAGAWAAASPKRTAGQYNVFNVDSMRGGTQAHWFVSARLFPVLLLAQARPGGLTQMIFDNGAPNERPVEMARRLRNDRVVGLGWCLGDKAADLFAKWAIGTLRLTPPGLRPWTAVDTVIPMDQRIGRLMMRCGFMDEFFSIPWLIRRSSPFTNVHKVDLPTDPAVLPHGTFHLTVMDFRRNERVRVPAAEQWLRAAWAIHHRSAAPSRWEPQEVVSLLCRVLTAHAGQEFSPVHLDDFFMGLGSSLCTDVDPSCTACPLEASCQANGDASRAVLKGYIT